MAGHHSSITISGRVGIDPRDIGPENAPVGVQFRLASTERYRDKNGAWQESPTTWVTVKAFKTLGSNIKQSIHKGDPVIVNGTMQTEQWTNADGINREQIVVHAMQVGHDLNYCIAQTQRAPASIADALGVPHATGATAVTEAVETAGASASGNYRAAAANAGRSRGVTLAPPNHIAFSDALAKSYAAAAVDPWQQRAESSGTRASTVSSFSDADSFGASDELDDEFQRPIEEGGDAIF